TPEEFVDVMTPWLIQAGLLTAEAATSRRGWLGELAPLVSERVKRLDEIAPMVAFLFTDDAPNDPAARASVLAPQGAAEALCAAATALAAVPEFSPAAVEEALRRVAEESPVKPKLLFQAVRVAVSGSPVSLPLFESVALLGKERSLERIRAACAVPEA
ncbi:MAG TPA: glutamate--tRNA ligase, partial [Coriobacteriia bacterium]|nr:glutamate--tRNA ligase [Coriobacteriia bacterium]